jgi:hypothetical protein
MKAILILLIVAATAGAEPITFFGPWAVMRQVDDFTDEEMALALLQPASHTDREMPYITVHESGNMYFIISGIFTVDARVRVRFDDNPPIEGFVIDAQNVIIEIPSLDYLLGVERIRVRYDTYAGLQDAEYLPVDTREAFTFLGFL